VTGTDPRTPAGPLGSLARLRTTPWLVGRDPTAGATAVGYALVAGTLLGSLLVLGSAAGGDTGTGTVWVVATAAALGQAVTNDGLLPSVGSAVAVVGGVAAVRVPFALALGAHVGARLVGESLVVGGTAGGVGYVCGLAARWTRGLVTDA